MHKINCINDKVAEKPTGADEATQDFQPQKGREEGGRIVGAQGPPFWQELEALSCESWYCLSYGLQPGMLPEAERKEKKSPIFSLTCALHSLDNHFLGTPLDHANCPGGTHWLLVASVRAASRGQSAGTVPHSANEYIPGKFPCQGVEPYHHLSEWQYFNVFVWISIY